MKSLERPSLPVHSASRAASVSKRIKEHARLSAALSDELVQYEQYLNSLSGEERVLNETLNIKQQQLDDLALKAEALHKQMAEMEDMAQERVKDADSELTKHKTAQMEAIARTTKSKEDLRQTKVQLEKLNTEVRERRAYLSDQEDLINSTIEDGNITMRQIQLEIEGLEERKRGVTNSLYELNLQKGKLEQDITDQSLALDSLKGDFVLRKDELDKILVNLEKNILGRSAVSEKVEQDITLRLRKLKEKEENLMAREAALRHGQEELVIERRRLDATSRLYD